MRKIVALVFVVVGSLYMYAQNYPERSDVLWVTTPNHTDWLYKLNEKATITIALYNYGILLDDAEISYSYGSELMDAEKEGVINIKNGKAELNIGTMKKPGFKDLRLRVTLNGFTYKHHIKVGFAPEQLEPYTQMPTDFIQFWEEAKAEAAKCPMEVEKTFVPEFSSDKIDCYLVKIQANKKGHFVYGYLTIPKKEGKFPVVFSPPGAGVKPMDPKKHLFYAESGVIRFDMEIHGIRPNLDAATYKEISNTFGNGENNYLVNGIDDKDRYYMKKVYLACVRVLDYLTTLPEWDGKNLIAQGGSQGGALALITTGLDNRITACSANHPALSDMAGYLDDRAGGYPHMFTQFDDMSKPEIVKTLQYFDVVNFAKQIKVPVFMTWGYNDNTCPPTTSYIVYNSLDTDKTSLITPVNEHWVSENTRRVILKWIQSKLK